MNNTAIVTKITNVRTHPNADRVLLATCHGNQVVVGLNTKEGDLGVYFQEGLQLSKELCSANNLYREASLNKNPKDKPGMFDNNGRVRAQKFRGEISDGYWATIDHFTDFVKNPEKMDEGYEFTELNGVLMCSKYITAKTAAQAQGVKKVKAAKSSIMFKEHIDTEHFGKHLSEFVPNERIIITEKVHGTSGRVGHVKSNRALKLYEKFLIKLGVNIDTTEWKYLNGSRRVVIEESNGVGFHDPTIREMAFSKFKGNLRKGETVFFEIVGFEPNGASIMPSVDTTMMKDKAFTKRWSNLGDMKTMAYSYGCAPSTQEVYVYRITMTNEDGNSVEYAWEDVKKRCEELNVKFVPEIEITTTDMIMYNAGGFDDVATFDYRNYQTFLLAKIDEYAKGASLLDSSHIREGVCVKIENVNLKNRTFKHKSFDFKVLEGIIKDSGVVDLEEAS